MGTLGKYINTNSYFHRLDPRAKLIALFVMITFTLIPMPVLSYCLLFGFILVLLIIAKTPLRTVKSIIKSIFFMLVLLLIFNIFLIKTGTILITIFGVPIYNGAIFQTVYIFMRLFMLLSVSMILTMTTKPTDLTLAIEKGLKPLQKFHFPAHEVAMIISIALRFIPVFAEETSKIMKAQTARGIDFEHGKIQEKIKGILSLIIPLFVSAYQKANDLANAMEARGYSTVKPRTKYRILKYRKQDFIFLFLMIVMIAIILGIGYAL